MIPRKPQINFQVDEAMKLLYDEAKITGHWVARFCAAGFLMMVESPRLRLQALNRLRDWESEYAGAAPEQIRAFVQGAETAMQRGARESRPTRPTRPARKKAKSARSG